MVQFFDLKDASLGKTGETIEFGDRHDAIEAELKSLQERIGENPKYESTRWGVWARIAKVLAVTSLVVFLIFLVIRLFPAPSRTAGLATGVIMFGALALFLVSAFLRGRMVHPTAAELLEHDKRGAIVYLREFADDAMKLQDKKLTAGGFAKTLAADVAYKILFKILLRRESSGETGEYSDTKALREVIGGTLGRFGPVIAVRKPGVWWTRTDLAEARFSDDQWRSGVRKYIDGSKLICVLIGRSQGLSWEIGQIAEAGCLGKAIFLFPPEKQYIFYDSAGKARRDDWASSAGILDNFQGEGGAASFGEKMGDIDLSDVICLYFDAGEGLTAIRCAAHTEKAYEAALLKAVHGLLCDARAPQAAAAAERSAQAG